MTIIEESSVGIEENELCNRDSCTGLMGYEAVEGCPCPACESVGLRCLECGCGVDDDY